MSCIDGPTFQCSGQSIIKTENRVALTSSGVQTYGKSTVDLVDSLGLTQASGGFAELRIAKDPTSGVVSKPALLLSDLGIFWDGVKERPPIIETFKPTAGIARLDPTTKVINSDLPLPPHTDLVYYDYKLSDKGRTATQANYANNRYFPRVDPSRCNPVPIPPAACPATETTGLQFTAGTWRNVGSTAADMAAADMSTATREHGDGDIAAGDNAPGATGAGVPVPGTKGTRTLVNWGFQYGNLSAWSTKDTVQIADWDISPAPVPPAVALGERNQNRRGVVAYGAVSAPAIVPTTGTATYAGFVYGWHTPNAATEVALFRGNATFTVNFATRVVVVTVTETFAQTEPDGPYTVPVALGFTATTTMGAANFANYLTGPVAGALPGGIGGRYFGPVVTGGSGAGPAEIGGAFSLSNAGRAVVAGFIGRKQ